MATGCQPARDSIEVPPFVELSDEQCDLIGCISDAQQMLNGGEFEHLEDSKEERFALLYRLVVQASKENCFGDFVGYVKQHVF